jgi:hypothetical protein
MTMTFDTKIAVVLRNDLPSWQKLNVTAFTISGIVGTVDGILGDNYEDASGNVYLPMIKQPVLIFEASEVQIQKAFERALQREVRFTVFTEELFSTSNDIDNRAAIRARKTSQLKVVGMGMRDKKKVIDRVLEGIALHK